MENKASTPTITPLRLFVYGSLREGRGNHYLLKEAKAERVPGMKRTPASFEMKDMGSFPGLVRGSAAIVGEVYALPDSAAFARFDRLEGHPDFYKREVVVLDDGTEAWVYVLTDGYRKRVEGSPVVECGDWCAYVMARPKLSWERT